VTTPTPARGAADITSLVAAQADELEAIALELHAHPETAFEERRSAELLRTALRAAEFEVEAPVAGLETAFVARHRFGPGGPRVALIAEYDALPGLGHACGHNLIAAASLGPPPGRCGAPAASSAASSSSSARPPRRAAAGRSSCWTPACSKGSTRP
jgi:hypothetical protein